MKKKNKIILGISLIAVATLIALCAIFGGRFIEKSNINKDKAVVEELNSYIKDWEKTATDVVEFNLTGKKQVTEEQKKLFSDIAKELGFDKGISKDTALEFSAKYLNQATKQPIGENSEQVYNRFTIILKHYVDKIPSAKVTTNAFWYSPDYNIVIYSDVSNSTENLNKLLPDELKTENSNNYNTWYNVQNGRIADKDVKIDVIYVGNGTHETEGKLRVGEKITIKGIPNEGFEVEGFYTADDKLLSEESEYQLTVSGDTTIYIKFKTKVCLIEISAGGGTVTGAGEYVSGEEVIVTADPSDGYVFNGFYIGEELVCTDLTYKFKAEDDCKIFADFSLVEEK